MSALRIVPALAWTALIAWFSTSDWSAAETGRFLLPLLKWLLPWAVPEQLSALHWLARKTAHAVEYGVLAALWWRALTQGTAFRQVVASLGLCVVTASLDELHQATTLTRTGSAADVLLDTAGAGVVVLGLTIGIRQIVTWLTSVLLWIAAAGGTLLLIVNWGAGAPSGWLWWSVPAAWLALAVWLAKRRIARRGALPPFRTSPQDWVAPASRRSKRISHRRRL